MSYIIPQSGYIISHDKILGQQWILRDSSWQSEPAQNLQNFFDNGYILFLQRIDALRQLQRPLTATEEKELRFMLEALMDAKNSLYI